MEWYWWLLIILAILILLWLLLMWVRPKQTGAPQAGASQPTTGSATTSSTDVGGAAGAAGAAGAGGAAAAGFASPEPLASEPSIGDAPKAPEPPVTGDNFGGDVGADVPSARLVGDEMSGGPSDAAAPYGEASVRANPDGSGPAGFVIKGNEESMLYHRPDSPSYDRTIAEVWFRSEEDARAAGFSPSGDHPDQR